MQRLHTCKRSVIVTYVVALDVDRIKDAWIGQKLYDITNDNLYTIVILNVK